MDELYVLLSRLYDKDNKIIRQLHAILYRYLEKRGRNGSSPMNYRERVAKLVSHATEEQAKVCWYFLKETME